MNKIKISFVVLLISILACDEIPDNIVDQKLSNTYVEYIEAPDEFTYFSSDSAFATSIKFKNTNSVDNVWLKVTSLDGSSTIHEQIFMSDEGDLFLSGDKVKGDNIFTALIPMSKNFPSGKYLIEYYLQNKTSYSQDKSLKVAVHSFNYSNTQINLPPVINEIIVPSTATYGQRITLMIKVQDSNGLNDISSVYYELYKPDGTKMVNSQGISQFPLFDDGNTSINGDTVAKDGTYSVFLTFPSGQPAGQWRFEFYAKDKGGLISNKAIHYLILN
ncbi:hypothetical protein [Rosettibacter firmus]|uniref:hypothetical protein n=1 Tax=Rosettibacter firmus TaxID=3111522 RepID=UPI00336BF636